MFETYTYWTHNTGDICECLEELLTEASAASAPADPAMLTFALGTAAVVEHMLQTECSAAAFQAINAGHRACQPACMLEGTCRV